MRACIDTFGGLVWTLSRRSGLSHADAEDASQEIFADVWRSAARYNPDLASETVFVATIARRRLIDRRRKSSRRPPMAELLDNLPAAQVEGLGDEGELASRALAEMLPEQQRVIRLSIVEGHTHEAIATATGLPLGTVKTHVRRGLIRLRELMGVSGRAVT